MTPREEQEYTALRATIRERGTARIWVFILGSSAWAGIGVLGLTLTTLPFVALLPLFVLAATFEGVYALHVGVERIGRYLQVYYEDSWEKTAMAFGAPLAGTSSDPMFALLFGLATAANFAPVLFTGPVPAELVAIGGAHALFLVRVIFARRASKGQRAADLERFQLLLRERDRQQ